MNITDLGRSFHERTLEKCHTEKVEAVRAAEQATWEAAEIVKKEALEVALKKAQLEHDKQIRKINKEHQRAIKVSVNFYPRF